MSFSNELIYSTNFFISRWSFKSIHYYFEIFRRLKIKYRKRSFIFPFDFTHLTSEIIFNPYKDTIFIRTFLFFFTIDSEPFIGPTFVHESFLKDWLLCEMKFLAGWSFREKWRLPLVLDSRNSLLALLAIQAGVSAILNVFIWRKY